MEQKVTDRGFVFYEFIDTYSKMCSLQKSSLAEQDTIWFGIDDPEPKILASHVREGDTGWVKYPIHPDVRMTTRMHLNREQVSELIPILQKFVETGEI